MITPLPDDVILKPSACCGVREQETRFLIYNQVTDELHLLSTTGFYVYRLCDGLNSVGDLCRMLATAMVGKSTSVRAKLKDFLGQLVDRGILEMDDDA